MYQDLPTEAVLPAADNLRRGVGDVSELHPSSVPVGLAGRRVHLHVHRREPPCG